MDGLRGANVAQRVECDEARKRAVEWANRHDLRTFACTGFNGGKLRTLAQQGLHVPLGDMGIVESIHLTAFHWVVDDLHRRIGMEN